MNRSQYMPAFHCPLCGFELTEVERPDPDDCEVECRECEKDGKCDIHYDESVWYKCENCNSFGDDYALVCHHPVHCGFGKDLMQSRPGDSWSLTWLKQEKNVNWYKKAKEEAEKEDNMEEMKEWFDKRTDRHIKLVQKYCKKLADYDKERFGDLIQRGKDHDQSNGNGYRNNNRQHQDA